MKVLPLIPSICRYRPWGLLSGIRTLQTLLCCNPLGSNEGKRAQSRVFEMRTRRLGGWLGGWHPIVRPLCLHVWLCNQTAGPPSVVLCASAAEGPESFLSAIQWVISNLISWALISYFISNLVVMLFKEEDGGEGGADVHWTSNLVWQLCGWPFYLCYLVLNSLCLNFHACNGELVIVNPCKAWCSVRHTVNVI